MLTCNPGREVPVTCLRGGYSASQGVVRSLLTTGTDLKSTGGMFLGIQSDIYYMESVRSSRRNVVKSSNLACTISLVYSQNKYFKSPN